MQYACYVEWVNNSNFIGRGENNLVAKYYIKIKLRG
jgi:hypothetical protein